MPQGRRDALTPNALADAANRLIMPAARRWWDNPLLRHARRLNPMPLNLLRTVAPWLAGLLAGGAILAWMMGERTAGRALGAALVGVSLGAVLIPVLAAGPVAALLSARQVDALRQNPYALDDITPDDFLWGLALSALWRLRWLVVLGLTLTPALMVSLLRLDVVTFTAWRDSALVLNGATAASRAAWLLPDGGIPLGRLIVRAFSAGLLPWAVLPLVAALGVGAGLRLPDASLSPLAAVIVGTAASAAIWLIWHTLTRWPVFSGPGEVIRVALIAGLLWLIGKGASWINDLNARLLVDEGG